MALDPLKRLNQILSDGWANLKTGLGDPRRDKRVHTVPTIDLLTYEECAMLYRASDICQKIVDEPSDTAFREGWAVKVNDGSGDKDLGEALDAELKKHQAYDKLTDALRWSKLYGGGALFCNWNDGQRADQKLDETRIKSLDSLAALDARECQPIDWYTEFTHPKFGLPRMYRVQPRLFATGFGGRDPDEKVDPGAPQTWLEVHESRILPMFGSRANRAQIGIDAARWGDSIFQRVWQQVADFDSSMNASSALLADFSQPVFKVQGLAQLMAADREDVVRKRIELLNLSRSVIRGILIDADGEDFSRQTASLSGLDAVLVQLANRVAAACDYPVSLLFGQAPAGLNANGASDVRFWYDRIANTQRKAIKPVLTRLVYLLALAKQGPGKGRELKDFEVQPNPLWQASENEQSSRNLAQAQADQVYLTNGVLQPDEVRQSRFGGDRYSLETYIEQGAEQGTSEAEQALLAAEGVSRMNPNGQPQQVHAGAVGASVQETAMSGVQVTSLIELVSSVVTGKIPRESGLAILKRAFQVEAEQAEQILGPPNFEATAEPKPVPLVPGAAPQPKGVPPGSPKEAKK